MVLLDLVCLVYSMVDGRLLLNAAIHDTSDSVMIIFVPQIIVLSLTGRVSLTLSLLLHKYL